MNGLWAIIRGLCCVYNMIVAPFKKWLSTQFSRNIFVNIPYSFIIMRIYKHSWIWFRFIFKIKIIIVCKEHNCSSIPTVKKKIQRYSNEFPNKYIACMLQLTFSVKSLKTIGRHLLTDKKMCEICEIQGVKNKPFFVLY